MSTDTPRSAVTEIRSFLVRCRRRIVDSCDLAGEFDSDNDGVTSLSDAEARFRAQGWRLHTDATASCPECLRAWDEGLDLPGAIRDEKGDTELMSDVDPSWVGRDPDEAKAAQNEAIRREVEGDGGLGETLATGAER